MWNFVALRRSYGEQDIETVEKSILFVQNKKTIAADDCLIIDY